MEKVKIPRKLNMWSWAGKYSTWWKNNFMPSKIINGIQCIPKIKEKQGHECMLSFSLNSLLLENTYCDIHKFPFVFLPHLLLLSCSTFCLGFQVGSPPDKTLLALKPSCSSLKTDKEHLVITCLAQCLWNSFVNHFCSHCQTIQWKCF